MSDERLRKVGLHAGLGGDELGSGQIDIKQGSVLAGLMQTLRGTGMKIIFSRKGFDKKNGGVASPILPDDRICSLSGSVLT
jgi:hypothetical protein